MHGGKSPGAPKGTRTRSSTDVTRLNPSLADEQLETIECESAEAALATMLVRGRDIDMIFADVRLPGAMDGIDLAWEVKLRWPLLPVVLTSGHPCDRAGDLPAGVDYMPKPWRPLNLLIVAEEALASAR